MLFDGQPPEIPHGRGPGSPSELVGLAAVPTPLPPPTTQTEVPEASPGLHSERWRAAGAPTSPCRPGGSWYTPAHGRGDRIPWRTRQQNAVIKSTMHRRVNPGITGWAQICYPYGASREDAKDKLEYDLYYIKNYSLFLDLMILIQTAQVILSGKGAR